jgi:hypothetical protein
MCHPCLVLAVWQAPADAGDKEALDMLLSLGLDEEDPLPSPDQINRHGACVLTSYGQSVGGSAMWLSSVDVVEKWCVAAVSWYRGSSRTANVDTS